MRGAMLRGCESTATHTAVNHSVLHDDRSLTTSLYMPKQFLRRVIPTPEKIREIKGLGVLGDWVYASNLWHLNRYSASMAFFAGLFASFLPMPGQTVVAATLAVLLRCNLPFAVSLVFLTNPVTMTPIFYLAYEIGAAIIDVPVREEVVLKYDLEWLASSAANVWKPFLLGSVVCGLFFGCLGYFVVNLLWRWRVARQWKARKRRRAARKLNDPD